MNFYVLIGLFWLFDVDGNLSAEVSTVLIPVPTAMVETTALPTGSGSTFVVVRNDNGTNLTAINDTIVIGPSNNLSTSEATTTVQTPISPLIKISLTELDANLIVGARTSPPPKNDTDSEATTVVDNTNVVVNFTGAKIRLSDLDVNVITGTRPPASRVIVRNATISSFVESNDTATSTINGKFDCRRDGHDCDLNGGTCDLDTGSCSCTTTNFTTFTCAYELGAMVERENCNNGTGCGDDPESHCVKQDDGFKCACPYHLYGEACEKKRYELRCSGSFMTLNIAPYYRSSGIFRGQLYLIDMATSTKIDDKSCAFSPLNNGISTLQLNYDDVTRCGGVSPQKDAHQLRFIVQSDPDWLTPFDQMLTASCSMNASYEYLKTVIVEASSRVLAGKAVSVSNDLTNVIIDTIKAQRFTVQRTAVIPTPVLSILQEVKTDAGVIEQEINGSIKIGDVIVFKISDEIDTFYSAMRAEECSIDMDEMMTAKLLQGQCPASRFAWSLLQWSKTQLARKSLKFYLRLPANAAAGHPRQVTISCRVKMCADDAVNECAAPDDNCKSAILSFMSPNSKARKRRDINNNEQSTAIVTVKRTIKLDYGEEQPQRMEAAPSTAPMLEIALSLLLFAAAICLLF